MTGVFTPRQISVACALALRAACSPPPETLRTLALSMVSHRTLLRGPGPLGIFDMDPKERAEKRRASHELSQTAIIAAGISMGIVFKNSTGMLEVR
jgi:hypothetical protein